MNLLRGEIILYHIPIEQYSFFSTFIFKSNFGRTVLKTIRVYSSSFVHLKKNHLVQSRYIRYTYLESISRKVALDVSAPGGRFDVVHLKP